MATSRTVEIINERGLHARASAKFVKLASGFDAEVTVSREGSSVDARSIMGLHEHTCDGHPPLRTMAYGGLGRAGEP